MKRIFIYFALFLHCIFAISCTSLFENNETIVHQDIRPKKPNAFTPIVDFGKFHYVYNNKNGYPLKVIFGVNEIIEQREFEVGTPKVSYSYKNYAIEVIGCNGPKLNIEKFDFPPEKEIFGFGDKTLNFIEINLKNNQNECNTRNLDIKLFLSRSYGLGDLLLKVEYDSARGFYWKAFEESNFDQGIQWKSIETNNSKPQVIQNSELNKNNASLPDTFIEEYILSDSKHRIKETNVDIKYNYEIKMITDFEENQINKNKMISSVKIYSCGKEVINFESNQFYNYKNYHERIISKSNKPKYRKINKDMQLQNLNPIISNYSHYISYKKDEDIKSCNNVVNGFSYGFGNDVILNKNFVKNENYYELLNQGGSKRVLYSLDKPNWIIF